MSIEDFKKCILFLKEDKKSSISLIGGEPTLHPKFSEILEIIKKVDFIDSIFIFSNGLFGDQIRKCFIDFSLVKKISFLINYNHPNILGKKDELLKENLRVLSKNEINIILGINLYKKNQDFEYLIEACNKYAIKNVRWALAVPNNNINSKIDVRAHFISYINDIFQLLEICLKNNIKPQVDCNNIPLCFLSDTELRRMTYLGNSDISICSPVIDILPNLDVIRCFAFPDYKVKLNEFRTSDEIYNHFEKNIDLNAEKRFLVSECENCISYQLRGKSCACLAYKMN